MVKRGRKKKVSERANKSKKKTTTKRTSKKKRNKRKFNPLRMYKKQIRRNRIL